MEMYSYDVECFKNYFLAVFVDVGDYFNIRNTTATDSVNVEEFERYILTAKRVVFTIGFGVNDIDKLVAFVNRNIILASFNGLDYDDILLNACIANINNWRSIPFINKKLYELSNRVISNTKAKIYNDDTVNVYKYMNTLYSSVDVQKVFGLNKVYKSLKQTLINVKWYNIEDYEMPPISNLDNYLYNKTEIELINKGVISSWERYIIKEFIPGLFWYCLNDANGVCEIIYQNREEVNLRFETSIKYSPNGDFRSRNGVNVLSSSRSNMADVLFGKFYCDASGLDSAEYKKGRTERPFVDIGTCIPSTIKFNNIELRKLLSKLKQTRIFSTKGELNFEVNFDGISYKLATGGLHSKDTPAKFVATDNILIKDADVTSYYPFIVLNNRIAPAHLDTDIFLNTTKGVIYDRVEAKRRGDKIVNGALKIVINVGVFGKMGFEDSPAYDPKAMVQVTITGQLGLLMLIEWLVEGGFKVISANTDGIVTIVPKDKLDNYYSICKKWEKYLNFSLEYTDYELYVRRDVNHYFAVKTGDKPIDERVKYKGALNPNLHKEELTKGYKQPIVATAISNYYLKDIPIMETLREHKDILDFCSTQKPGANFSLELHNVTSGKVTIIKLSKDIRFYVSKGCTKLLSGLLLKNDITLKEGQPRKYTNIVSKRNITVFNKKIDFDNFDDYKIDYGYYYTEASKIINAIESGTTDKRKIKKEYGQYKLNL